MRCADWITLKHAVMQNAMDPQAFWGSWERHILIKKIKWSGTLKSSLCMPVTCIHPWEYTSTLKWAPKHHSQVFEWDAHHFLRCGFGDKPPQIRKCPFFISQNQTESSHPLMAKQEGKANVVYALISWPALSLSLFFFLDILLQNPIATKFSIICLRK
jgi:hypothetical protein